MTEQRIDAETMAAFLDGKLEREERERVIRILAEHPEEYEVFADAAHLAAELARDTGSVIPMATGRRGRRGWVVAIPALIAASIAVVLLLPPAESLSPRTLAGRLSLGAGSGQGSLAARLGAAWEQPGWSVTRGAGTSMAEPALAFRLGARATDVEIALQARDTSALRLVAADLIELLSGVDGGAAAAAMYQRIVARGTGAEVDERGAAADAVRALLGDSPWFDLGAWAEAARVALMAGQTGFLAESVAELDGLIRRLRARTAAESGEVIGILESLAADVRSGGVAPDAAETSRRLTQLMSAAGR